jgi:hypothetical protein
MPASDCAPTEARSVELTEAINILLPRSKAWLVKYVIAVETVPWSVPLLITGLKPGVNDLFRFVTSGCHFNSCKAANEFHHRGQPVFCLPIYRHIPLLLVNDKQPGSV